MPGRRVLRDQVAGLGAGVVAVRDWLSGCGLRTGLEHHLSAGYHLDEACAGGWKGSTPGGCSQVERWELAGRLLEVPAGRTFRDDQLAAITLLDRPSAISPAICCSLGVSGNHDVSCGPRPSHVFMAGSNVPSSARSRTWSRESPLPSSHLAS